MHRLISIFSILIQLMRQFIPHTILILLFWTLALSSAKAQEPYYTQYYNAPIYYNPALTGIDKGLKIRVNYRDQWPQYTDDLKSYNFSMDVAERFMPGAGGLGIIFNTNKEGKGFIKRNQVGLSASVRIRFSNYWKSQLGFLLSYIQKQIDNDDFIYSDQLDNLHGLLYTHSSFPGFSNQNTSYADLNLGYAVKYEKHYLSATFGIAVHHVTKPDESFSTLQQKLPRKYIFTSDFVILQRSNPRKGFKFNPGLLYEYFAGYHTFTLGSNVSKSVMYAGLWYRSKQSQIYNYQSVAVLVGLNIPMVNKYSRLKFMYSYDISVNNMKGNGGAHEITLRFEFDQIHLFKSNSAFADDYPIIYDPVIF